MTSSVSNDIDCSRFQSTALIGKQTADGDNSAVPDIGTIEVEPIQDDDDK
jgi:hypothetical protein